MKKVRWGILSTAKIGLNKVIPAMQKGEISEVCAIASRDLGKAREVSKNLGIARAYGSYEALLADGEIDAIYIPLPNHLHVPWSIKALEAGKHVLCEKPIGLTAEDGEKLLTVSKMYPHLKVMEAFMYRFHPQWQKTKQLIEQGAIGNVRTIHSFFSYHNTDANNIRNQADIGGGGLMDIGCYCISLSRFIYASEPRQISGIIEYDLNLKIDRMASGMLEFEQGTATFTCSTQISPFQRVNIVGTQGRIEIEIPFNAPVDKPCKIWLQQQSGPEEILFPVCDQYTIQGDLFSQAILEDKPVPTPLKDGVENMRVLEALKRSAQTGKWVTP